MPRYFGRADLSQPLEDGFESGFVIDAIRADWRGFESGPFALDANMGADGPASGYWRALFESRQTEFDAFEGAPLVRIELNEPQVKGLSKLSGNEQQPWLEFEVGRHLGVEAILFEPGPKGLFDDGGTPTGVGDLEESGYAPALANIFDMTTWPNADVEEITFALRGVPALSQLIAIDVGQGGANALTDTEGTPRMYFDAGAGMGINAKSTPAALSFCVCKNPPVLLSHWDTDHWAGARADPTLLTLVWIAPRQPIGPTHAKFANDLLQSGGTLLIYASKDTISLDLQWAKPRWGRAHASADQTLLIVPCTGRTRNDSGLVLVVHDNDRDLDWLLTGDASYDMIPLTFAPDQLVVVTASHHGAKQPRKASNIPSRPSPVETYARLLYSFARPNSFKHPHATAVADNLANGWRHGTMTVPHNPKGLDALATGLGDGTRPRTSVAAGWRRRPLLPAHLLTCIPNTEILR